MVMKPDTYFFSSDEALRVATEQNRSDDILGYALQVCYYNGDVIESDLVNFIHLDVNNLVDELARGRFRIPTHFDFTGLDISIEVAKDIEKNLLGSIENAKALRHEMNRYYLDKIKRPKLDFNEPLRIYLLANSRTRVIQYISKDIADFFENKGFNICYDLLYGIEESVCFKNIFEFNPHITININHLSNVAINDDTFNFVWYQDNMPVLKNNNPIMVRKRDYIFTYVSFMNDSLIKKGVDINKIFDQQIIPVNTQTFYLDKNIKKEKKIIFVGTKYHRPYKKSKFRDALGDDIELLLADGECLSKENINKILDKHKVPDTRTENTYDIIRQVYVRNKCVEWMSLNDNIDTEIYGYDWDKSENENIIKNFKGKVEKDDLNRLYNSTKYILSASGQVINTQRLGEIIHAGAIPVIFDSRDITDEKETWEEECLYFKTQDELNYILDNELEPKKYRTKRMLEYFTYDKFVDTILSKVHSEIKAIK